MPLLNDDDQLTHARVNALIRVCAKNSQDPRDLRLADEAAAIIERRAIELRTAETSTIRAYHAIDHRPH